MNSLEKNFSTQDLSSGDSVDAGRCALHVGTDAEASGQGRRGSQSMSTFHATETTTSYHHLSLVMISILVLRF